MLDVFLKILSVIGTVLLVFLVVLVVVLLLVLFFPVTYKASGKKNQEDMQAWVKLDWLFGLFRLRFFYPKPGNITVKLLWFSLYDSAKSGINDSSKSKGKSDASKETSDENMSKDEQTKKIQTASDIPEAVAEKAVEEGKYAADDTKKQGKKNFKEFIFEKCDKLKYTIRKIYDKIKHICKNISFYMDLFQDEQTKELLRHAFFRLGRILKSIKPRKFKGDILFGTGSPDTTGYVFGIYGMLVPWMGKYINVTPDFTQAVLEGELYAAGHITVFQLLRHGVMLVVDKRLRLLVHRIKTHTI